MSLFTAVLVNFNAGDGAAARPAVARRRDARTADWDAVVVDNASTDGSEAIARSSAAAVRLIRNARQRRLLPAASTRGLRRSDARSC